MDQGPEDIPPSTCSIRGSSATRCASCNLSRAGHAQRQHHFGEQRCPPFGLWVARHSGAGNSGNGRDGGLAEQVVLLRTSTHLCLVQQPGSFARSISPSSIPHAARACIPVSGPVLSSDEVANEYVSATIENEIALQRKAQRNRMGEHAAVSEGLFLALAAA